MSDLLNKASLVMVPSGYKEDTVYSVVPTDGSGDLTFTRASNGTRVNSAGLVEVAPWNLYTYSEEFNNSIWANGNATITANTTTAPNGTTTADSIFEQAVNDYQIKGQNFSMVDGETFTYSIYVKANTRNYFRILVGNGVLLIGQFAYFDLVNLTTTTSSSQITSSITSAGNGWCKIVISFTCNKTGNDAIYFGPSPNMTSGYLPFFGDASKSVYIWGAQLNIGSTAKPYFPTTDRLNVPRLTYQNGGGGCPSLLLEKQSTNLLNYSEDFGNSYWLKFNGTISTNTTTSPDGTQNADSLVSDSGQYGVLYISSQFTAGQNITLSIFAKANTSSQIRVGTTDAGVDYGATFNLSSQTITSITGVTASIESMGNGWYRCIVNRTMAGNANMFVVEQEGNKSVYLWGAQAEASSYATSYIPTTSSSATRVADACYKTGISSLIGQSEGVVFVDFMVTDPANFQSIQIYNNERNASVISVVSIQFNIDTVIGQIFRGNGTFDNILLSKNGYGLNQRLKVAFRYKSGDLALYINGVQAATDSGTYTANGTKSEVNLCDPTVYFAYKGGVNLYDFVQFPTALTNAELASLTTL